MVRVEIDTAYQLKDVVAAFEKLRSGRSRGNIIIHISKKP